MWISQNLLIISEIWLIQIAKIAQIASLIASVKINWFNSENIFSADSISDNQLT